jgi:hypothetical protein
VGDWKVELVFQTVQYEPPAPTLFNPYKHSHFPHLLFLDHFADTSPANPEQLPTTSFPTMCKGVTIHSYGGLKATGKDIACSNPTADGSKCQQFMLALAVDNCDTCYICKTDTAEGKGKVEEAIAERNKETKSEAEEETGGERDDKRDQEARAEGGH